MWRIITVVYRTKLEELPEMICSEESRELCFLGKEEVRKVKVAATHIPIVEEYVGESNR